jgi:hypothetical protein
MQKGIYNLIIALCIVLFVVVAFMLGSYFWYQYGISQVAVKQADAPVFQQAQQVAAQQAQSTQVAQPLSLTTPLKVSVNGRVYPIDVVSARDGWVTISTRKELGKFADLEIKISLTNQHIDSFSNKTLHFTGKDFSEPHIQVSWMEPGKNLPKSEFISKNYDLLMQFGQEQDYRIPFQIKLDTREKVTVKAAGKYTARTSDLVVVNGKVDLHRDNTDTVLYVIEQFIKQVDGVPEVKGLKNRSHSMSMPGKDEKPDPNPGRVYSSASINVDFETHHRKEAAEFQMVRTNSGWQVYRALKPARFKAAVEPDLSLDTLFLFDYLGEQVVTKSLGKDKVEEWERKGSMLQHRNPDPKRDQTQIASASYLVKLKDGARRYVKVAATKRGHWQIDHIFDGTQIPQAHAKKPAVNQRGSDMQKYLSAVRLEKSLNKQYPDLQVRGADFSCGYSNLLTQCRISWRRLVDGEEKCEGTKYMYRRNDKNSPWQFVRELAADEELDHRDGQVKKKDKPRKYHCW